MDILETTSTTFPDVDLSATIEQTRADGNTRLLHVTKFWSKHHIDSWVLPRWRSIYGSHAALTYQSKEPLSQWSK